MQDLTVDPITLELVHEGLIAIVREMRANTLRTSYSSIVYEGQDFSCCLVDARGQLIAKAPADNPGHIFPVSWSVRTVLDRFGDDVQPGDVFIHNDPFTGGSHLNDVATICPVFIEGQLFAFAVIRVHWGDIGGMTPGSLSGQTTEIYQEGVRIPAIRVYDRGKPNQAALDLLFANVRGVRQRQGDFTATLVGCRQAALKLAAMAGKYGMPTLRACLARFIERSEARMRRSVAALPDGTYAYEGYVESTGRTLTPLLIALALSVSGEEMTFDFTGSSPQTEGPTNIGPSKTPTAVFMVVKSYLDPTAAVNQGAWAPLNVRAPEGTCLNARMPAACGGMGEMRRTVEGVVMGALAAAIPEGGTGENKGCGNHVYIAGYDERGEHFLSYEFPAAGTGAFSGGDGNNAVRYFTEGDFGSIQPMEAVENEHPLLVERCEIRSDSAGAGCWRGGFGLRRDVRVLVDQAQLSVLTDRNILGPWGVYGGEAGAGNRFTVLRDGREIEPSSVPGKVSGFRLRRGDVIVERTSGGGGYGDPMDRPSAQVWRDVAYGYLTAAAARAHYGVVVTSGGVDEPATAALRETMRGQRAHVRLASGSGAEFDGPRRILPLARPVAEREGIAEGDIVELVNPRGAPLRAWAHLVDEDSDRVYLGPLGMRVLGGQVGDSFQLRRLTAWEVPPPAGTESETVRAVASEAIH